MEKRKVLICGSTGFIGRNLVERLIQRDDLEIFGTHFKRPALDIKGFKSIFADLTDSKSVDEVIKNKDIVIQAAATTSGAKDIVERPYIHVTDNAVMNSHILRSCYKNNIKHFLFFSCSVMYQSSEKPLKENDFDESIELHHNYFGVGWTKVYIENMCKFYSRLRKTKHTVFRNSNIYGPYDKYDKDKSHVFGATVAKVMDKNNNLISVWGDGMAERDLLYVKDLVNLVETAIDNQKSLFELVNASLGNAITIKELVLKIIKSSGRKIDIIFDKEKPSINTQICLDNSKAKDIFKWEPKYNLEKGIKETIKWYQENICENE